MPERKLIGRVARDTSGEPRSTSGRIRRLPDDLLRQATRRLQVMSLVAVSLWILAPGLGHLAFYASNPGDPRWRQLRTPDVVAAAGVVTSLALFSYLRKSKHGPAFVMDLNLMYLVVNAFAIGVLMHWGPPSVERLPVSPIITWIGPILLISAAIVPAPPGKFLLAGFLAASMDPLGMMIGKAAGIYEFGPLRNLLVMHYPNYLLLGCAVVISQVVTRLGQQVSKERELGSYRLGELLGQGGMGQVFRATHRMLARPAAIKLINPEMVAAGSGENAQLAITRFRREAEAAAHLRSPHTVELYDFGVTDDQTLYFVMELLDGMDLETLVRAGRAHTGQPGDSYPPPGL